MQKRLTRNVGDNVIAGVCGGLADYFDFNPSRVRIAFVLFGIFGAGILAYILLWIVMPQDM